MKVHEKATCHVSHGLVCPKARHASITDDSGQKPCDMYATQLVRNLCLWCEHIKISRPSAKLVTRICDFSAGRNHAAMSMCQNQLERRACLVADSAPD